MLKASPTLALTLALATPVHADDTRPFVMMDLDPSSHAGVATMIGTTDRVASSDDIEHDAATLASLDVDASARVADHLELAVGLPFAWMQSGGGESGNGNVYHDTGTGNVWLAARFFPRPWGGTEAHGRLGIGGEVACCTASSGTAEVLVNRLHLPHRYARYLPGATSVSIDVSGALDTERMFVQGELGFTIMAWESNYDDGVLPLFRAGFGGGVRVTPHLAVLAELSMLALSDAPPYADLGTDNFFGAVDFGARYQAGRLSIAARGYLPVGTNMADIIDWGAGIDVLVAFDRLPQPQRPAQP